MRTCAFAVQRAPAILQAATRARSGQNGLACRRLRASHWAEMGRLGFCLFVAMSLGASAAPARAFCRLTTKAPLPGELCRMEGTELAWDRQCISYSLVPMTGPGPALEDVRNAIDRSFSAWEGVDCGAGRLPLDLRQTTELGGCMRPEYNRFDPNANTIMFLSHWQGEDFPPTAFGLTLVWHHPMTGQIYDSDMQINETLGAIAICGNDCDRDEVDLENVITHEAGHFLGLGHSDVDGSTMFASADAGETLKRTLEQDDRNGICAMYGGLAVPVCETRGNDFAPDRGFSAQCGERTEQSACAVRAPGASNALQAGAWAGLIGAALALVRRRRR